MLRTVETVERERERERESYTLTKQSVTLFDSLTHTLCLPKSKQLLRDEKSNIIDNDQLGRAVLAENKKEQGITIISLVVTVIILLILAGVAIRSITGDNGLISRTKSTVEESKKAEYREGIDTIGLGVKLKTAKDHLSNAEYIEEYYQELLKEKENQGSIFKDSNIKKKNDETIRVETKEGYIYYVREDETIYVGKVRRSRRRKYSRIKTRRYII